MNSSNPCFDGCRQNESEVDVTYGILAFLFAVLLLLLITIIIFIFEKLFCKGKLKCFRKLKECFKFRKKKIFPARHNHLQCFPFSVEMGKPADGDIKTGYVFKPEICTITLDHNLKFIEANTAKRINRKNIRETRLERIKKKSAINNFVKE